MNLSWLTQRPWLMTLGLMLTIALGLYFAPLAGITVFTGPDTLSPTAIAQGLDQLAKTEGELPLWQPHRFSGMPSLHAFSGISVRYLPNRIFALMQSAGIPQVWEFILHLIFGAMGMWVLLRYLGASNWAAALGATGFMLMPYTHAMVIHGHGSQMMTLVYMPWVVWSLIRLQEHPGFQQAAVVALFTGLHLQRGHAQISYYILLLSGLLYLALAIRTWRDERSSGGDLAKFSAYAAGGLLLGFALAAALFLPAMSYAPYSVRGATGGGAGFDYATQWSFSFGETVTWLVPSYYGFGGTTYWGNMPFTDYPNYMGILMLSLAVWAVWRYRTWWSRTLSVAALLAYLLSLGSNFFLYRIFYDLMPYFSKFRVPTMMLVITQFSIVVLAGMGLDHLLKAISAGKEAVVRKGLLMVGGGIASLAFVLWLIGREVIPVLGASRNIPPNLLPQITAARLSMITVDTIWLLIITATALGLLWRWRTERMGTLSLMVALIALNIVDIGRIDWKMISPGQGVFRSSVLQPAAAITRYLTPDPVVQFLQNDPGNFRIYPLGALQSESRWAAFGLSSIGGYHPAKLVSYERLMATTGFRSEGILKMLNVRYLISQQRITDAGFNEIFSEAFVGNLYYRDRYVPTAVYRFERPLARAWFPQEVGLLNDVETILTRLTATDYDPQSIVYLIDDPAGDSVAGGQGEITVASWSPSHISLKLEVERAGLLTLSEIYYPEGWVARINGEKALIHEVNTVLRGIVVPSGAVQLTLDFEPDDVRLGLLISRSALLLLLLAFAPSLYSRYKGRS